MTVANALAGLSALLAAALSPSPSAPDETRVVFKCSEKSVADPSRFEGLRLQKVFLADGTLDAFTVEWRGQKQGLVEISKPAGKVDLLITWPGSRDGRSTPDGTLGQFDALNGTVWLHQNSNKADQRRNDERWSQTVITRIERQGTYQGYSGNQFDRFHVFSSDNSGNALASNFATLGWERDEVFQPVVARFPVSSLLAWGHDIDRLFALDTRATPIKGRNLDKWNPPIIRQRIVLGYSIGIKPLKEVIAYAKEAVPLWEAEVSDYRNRCSKEVEDVPQIIVTSL